MTIRGEGHRARFDSAWDASAGHITFLGDWHTHPGGPAIPSRRDARAMRRLAKESDFGTPRPLVAILAAPRWPWRTRPTPHVRWYLRVDEQLIVELEPWLEDELPTVARAVPTWPWPARAS